MSIMNNEIDFFTEGKGVKFADFVTKYYYNEFKEEVETVSTGKIIIGDLKLKIFFKSHEELVSFCEKHQVIYKIYNYDDG